MKNKYVYITTGEYFNRPIYLRGKIEEIYPHYQNLTFDLHLLVTEAPDDAEKYMPIYNDYRERYGSSDIDVFTTAAKNSEAKNVFLNSFRQEHFDYIAPFIKDKAEVLYLFKCPKIKDLSALTEFSKLKCVVIFWNNTLEKLWDMKNNKDLKILSFDSITKLTDINSLKDTNVEYVSFDSRNNGGSRKEMLFDRSVFDDMPNLKHLKLVYKSVYVDY